MSSREAAASTSTPNTITNTVSNGITLRDGDNSNKASNKCGQAAQRARREHNNHQHVAHHRHSYHGGVDPSLCALHTTSCLKATTPPPPTPHFQSSSATNSRPQASSQHHKQAAQDFVAQQFAKLKNKAAYFAEKDPVFAKRLNNLAKHLIETKRQQPPPPQSQLIRSRSNSSCLNINNSSSKTRPEMETGYYPHSSTFNGHASPYMTHSSIYASHSHSANANSASFDYYHHQHPPHSQVYGTFNASVYHQQQQHQQQQHAQPPHPPPPTNPPPPPPPRPPPIHRSNVASAASAHRYATSNSNHFQSRSNNSNFNRLYEPRHRQQQQYQFSNHASTGNGHMPSRYDRAYVPNIQPQQIPSFFANMYSPHQFYGQPHFEASPPHADAFASYQPQSEDLLFVLEDAFDPNKITVQMTRTQKGPNGEQQRVTVERDFRNQSELNTFLKQFEDNIQNAPPKQPEKKSFKNTKMEDLTKSPGVIVVEEPGEEPKLYRQDTGELVNADFIDPLIRCENNEHPIHHEPKKEPTVAKLIDSEEERSRAKAESKPHRSSGNEKQAAFGSKRNAKFKTEAIHEEQQPTVSVKEKEDEAPVLQRSNPKNRSIIKRNDTTILIHHNSKAKSKKELAYLKLSRPRSASAKSAGPSRKHKHHREVLIDKDLKKSDRITAKINSNTSTVSGEIIRSEVTSNVETKESSTKATHTSSSPSSSAAASKLCVINLASFRNSSIRLNTANSSNNSPMPQTPSKCPPSSCAVMPPSSVPEQQQHPPTSEFSQKFKAVSLRSSADGSNKPGRNGNLKRHESLHQSKFDGNMTRHESCSSTFLAKEIDNNIKIREKKKPVSSDHDMAKSRYSQMYVKASDDRSDESEHTTIHEAAMKQKKKTPVSRRTLHKGDCENSERRNSLNISKNLSKSVDTGLSDNNSAAVAEQPQPHHHRHRHRRSSKSKTSASQSRVKMSELKQKAPPSVYDYYNMNDERTVYEEASNDDEDEDYFNQDFSSAEYSLYNSRATPQSYGRPQASPACFQPGFYPPRCGNTQPSTPDVHGKAQEVSSSSINSHQYQAPNFNFQYAPPPAAAYQTHYAQPFVAAAAPAANYGSQYGAAWYGSAPSLKPVPHEHRHSFYFN